MENLVKKINFFLVKKALRFIDKYSFSDLSVRAHNHSISFHRNDYVVNEGDVAIIHLPKTGGTTLKNVLNTSTMVPDGRIKNMDAHMPISLVCPPENSQYITFMRNPIDRVFSYYKMQLRDNSQPYHFHAKDGLSTLLQSCWEVRNTACMYYSGMIYESMTRQHLRTSIDNLNNFLFVGDFSDFDNELIRLQEKLHVNAQRAPHLNSSETLLPNKYERTLIRSYNMLDIELYDDFFKKNFKVTE